MRGRGRRSVTTPGWAPTCCQPGTWWPSCRCTWTGRQTRWSFPPPPARDMRAWSGGCELYKKDRYRTNAAYMAIVRQKATEERNREAAFRALRTLFDATPTYKVGCTIYSVTRRGRMAQEWYHAKADMEAALVKAPGEGRTVYLGRDAGTGKAFTYFRNFEEMERYVLSVNASTSSSPSLYEIIYDKGKSRVYVYFDLDRDVDPVRDEHIMADIGAYRARFVATFINAFETFLKLECGTDVSLVPGLNCQIACSSHEARLSFHTKIDIPCDSPLVVKEIGRSFQRFILTLPLDEQSLFVFDHFNDAKQKMTIRSVFDESVYSQFRHFRLLYSSKSNSTKSKAPKLPYAGSSMLVRDHVVQQHAGVVTRAPITLARLPATLSAGCAMDGTVMLTPVSGSTSRASALLASEEKDDRERSGTTSVIPHLHLAAVRDALLRMAALRERLCLADGTPLAFKHSRDKSPTEFSFNIDPACQATCPYAGRRHASNRLSLVYYHRHGKVLLHCFDDDCRGVDKAVYDVGPDPMLRRSLVAELDSVNSLHCREKVIDWDLVYNHHSMHAYPVAPIVCVRSNMGMGKTVTLIDLIREQCNHKDAHVRPVKCLLITYQVLLSRKYSTQLACHGFVNYLDAHDQHGTNCEIRDNNVIVCLDSLWRVKTSNFDFVFIDEALSVLMHFNSKLMKRVSDISMVFELFLLQAKHIYLLDAAVDNAVVHDFVQYLERTKKVRAVWVRNTYRHETNRSATLMINTCMKPGNRAALLAAAVKHAVEALRGGRRIVISSTTKRFTDIMAYELERQVPGKRIVVYNSATDRTMLQEHASNPHLAWIGYDALIYSPTIGSGISFEVAHFDELIAWVENTLDSATVDLSIQQLYRVRQLASGRMTLFVQNTASKPASESGLYPVLSEAVEDWLDASVNSSSAYLSADLAGQSKAISRTGQQIVYDRQRLSFHVLKGIVYTKHKSLVHFQDILVNTLERDYGISCDVREFKPSQDGLEAADLMAKRLQAYDKRLVIPFDADLIVTARQYDELMTRSQKSTRSMSAAETLTPREMLQVWIHQVCTDMYGIDPRQCDQAFFDAYVGQATRVHMEAAHEVFYRLHRLSEVMTSTAEESVYRYAGKMAAIVDTSDCNMELYRTRVRAFHEQVIVGSRLLEDVFPDTDVHKALRTREELVLSPSQILDGVRRWTGHTSQAQYTDVLKRLDHSRIKRYSMRALLDADGTKRVAFLRAVFGTYLGVELVDYQDNIHRTSHPLYGFKMLVTSAMSAVVDKYEPTAFAMRALKPSPVAEMSYMFAEDDEGTE